MARTLPKWMHEKHGAFYLVRRNTWVPLGRNLHNALVEYARLTAGVDKAALPELVGRCLADMKLTVAASTYKSYQIAAKRFEEAFAEFAPQQIKPHHLATFMDDNKHQPTMANLYHAFMGGLFSRACRWGVIEVNPLREVKKFKTEARDRLLTNVEWFAIRQHASPTLQCMMDISYITGQRIGDVMKIKYSDISDEGVFFKQKKTKTRLLVAMTHDLRVAVQAARELNQSVKGMTLFHKRDGAPLAYTTIYGHWRRACESAGVEDAHFHDIRADAATEANRAGRDSKALLGHASEQTHKRYLRSKEVPVATPNPARKQN